MNRSKKTNSTQKPSHKKKIAKASEINALGHDQKPLDSLEAEAFSVPGLLLECGLKPVIELRYA